MQSNAPVPQLRSGLSTGTCACAATQAALDCLLRQKAVYQVEVCLPDGTRERLSVGPCQWSREAGEASVQKNAGDDPDVTHGAKISSRVRWKQEPGIRYVAGPGVGTVTLPGLPLAVGEPAINPIPRRMIEAAVTARLSALGLPVALEVTLAIEGGERLAEKTLNARLGIIGGLSILGTSGRVQPFSSSAYLASMRSAMAVVAASGSQEIVLTAGARTEAALRRFFPQLPSFCFVHYGNWIGAALDMAVEQGLRRLTLGMMVGKAVKLSIGQWDTHSRVALWQAEEMALLARSAGYDANQCELAEKKLLARELVDLFPLTPSEPFWRALSSRVLDRCHERTQGRLQLAFYLHGEAGECLHYLDHPRSAQLLSGT